MTTANIILIVAFGIVGLISLFSIWVITQQKTSKILTMFGKYYKVTKPGLSLKLPWPFVVQEATMQLNVQEVKGEVTVKSSDNAFLIVPWALQFQVIEEKVKEAYYELEDAEDQMKSYILNTLRGEASNLTMQQLFQSNESFERAVGETLTDRFGQYGYKVINVLVDDPQPSDEVRQAFDLVISSQRKKEAAVNEAEAIRIKMVGEAKAEGESLEIKGKAFKQFRQDIAEGNSDSIRVFLKDLPDDFLNSKDVLDFFAGVDVREAIRDAAAKPGNLVVVPVDFQQNLTLPNFTGEKIKKK